MYKIIFLSVLILPFSGLSTCLAQDTLKVKEIQAGWPSKHHPKTDSIFTFPKFYGSTVAKSINLKLLDYINSFGNDLHKKTIQGSLNALVSIAKQNRSGLVHISYKIFYSANTVSLKVYYETVGVGLSTSTDYLTFSTITGNKLTLYSLIKPEKKPSFEELLELKQEQYLINYKYRIHERLVTGSIDSTEYNRGINWWANEVCADSFDGKLGKPDYSDFMINGHKIKFEVGCAGSGKPISPYTKI